LAPRGIALHPSQIYESIAEFIIFLILMAMRRKLRFQGKLIWFYLLFYSAARFFLEFFRDDPRGWVIPQTLSTAQAVGIPAALLAIYMILRKKSTPLPSPRT
jgi:phosphatidylglycerol:prolipoprotein diacylglycerol transferase